MNTAEFLIDLRAKGIALWSENDTLHYRGPKGAVTAEIRSQLTERKIEILALLGQEPNESPLYLSPLRDSCRTSTDALSYAEESLWLLNQIKPGSAWNMQSCYRLRGAFSIEVLEQSLNELVNHQHILRTAFKLAAEGPVRIVVPSLTVEIPLSELGPSTDADEEIRRLAKADAKFPFELSQSPLFRTRIIRIHEQEHVFLLTMHHMITDAASNRIFFRELFALYETFSEGRPSPLQNLPVHYADYAAWVRAKRVDSHISYWKSKLEGFTVTQIPTEKQRTATISSYGANEQSRLDKTLAKRVKQLCARENATVFMLMVATFKILLRRYTGSTDITIGSVVSGRNEPELEHVMGIFANIIILRSNLSGEPTFREVLRRVREVCLEGYEHQDVPLEKLTDALKLGGSSNGNRFFQVLFDVNNLRPTRHEVTGLKVEPVIIARDTSRYELVLRTLETNDGFAIIASYNTDLFSRDWIAEILRQYKFLLEQIVDDPDRNIDDYSLVSHSHDLLPDPTTPLDESWGGSVHEIIADYGTSRPEKLAIEDANEAWSYKELNERSNQLAHRLLAHGIQREEIIAIYGPRCAGLVWALVGVLKSGAAFLVIDPQYPTQRVLDYFEIAKPRGLIEIGGAELEKGTGHSSFSCRIALPTLADARSQEFLKEYSTENPAIEISKDTLAYVIFTSGSTGKPKAVMGRHGPLTHFLPWLRENFSLSDDDRFSFLSSLSTNKLQREVLTALGLGGTLYIPGADSIGNPGALDAWIRTHQISALHLSPAMAQLLADSATDIIPSVRTVFFGGDLLRKLDIARTRELMPQAEIVNLYNSSETQRGGGYKLFPRDRAGEEKDIPPLGHGVKDVQLLVVNGRGKVAGIGELGEIWVRSPHLARGYLGDDKLSNERFIVNPFTDRENDRIFRTGERGRYLLNGEVEYVSRGESQVSIRGFRVELGEIESVLRDHRNLKDAAVVGYGDPTERMVAYVTPMSGVKVDASELRRYLRPKLPNHMIPSAFVVLEAFPLTATGKVDRKALPDPGTARTEQEQIYVPAGTLIEEQLVEIWQTVLKIERVGIYDDFFDLGGHSLSAVRLFAQIEKITGIRLPVAALFHAPTIEQLAKLMSEQGGSGQWRSLVAIQPEGSQPPLFCVHAHDGGVLFWRDLARYLGSDQPFYALQPRGLDGLEPLHTTIEEMALHYVQEMRTLQPDGPYYISGHCIGGLVAFEMAQQLHAQGERVALLALIDSFAPARQTSKRSSLFRRYRYRAISLFERTVALHFGNLAVLKPGERLTYVKGKIDKALYKLYMGLGSRWVPAARNRQNILKAASRASRGYTPKSYSGKITLFRATDLGGGIERDRQMGWGRLAAGDLETHIIPGYHAHIVLEPRVRILAKELSRSLAEAQQAKERKEIQEQSHYGNRRPLESAKFVVSETDTERYSS